jgi:two-component system nitrogen regulation response regulator NtrX
MPKGKILVVDDDTAICSSLSSILSDEGFEVETAESAEYCLELLGKTDFDLILLDIWLPGMHGLMALEEIIKRKINVSVVIISAHGSIEMAVKATKLGAFDFLEKPLSIDKTLLVVQNAIKQKKLEEENKLLKKKIAEKYLLVGESDKIKRLKEEIEKAAPTNGRTLIYGENGTGKELVARNIHLKSLRANEIFAEVNCAAIPEELIESELFGYVKGAFTGAITNKDGKLKIANGGTLFLDEIGDMSLKTQSKLLRVIEEQKFEPLGSNKSISIDIRLISATNKILTDEIKKGNFREDLYFRINVIPIYVPPLRERKEDIPLLVNHFIQLFSQEYGRKPKELSKKAISLLQNYDWPGNVRELKNLIERLMIMVNKDFIDDDDIISIYKATPFSESTTEIPDLSSSKITLPFKNEMSLQDARAEFEKQYISIIMKNTEGNIAKAARILNIDRRHLYRKLHKYNLFSTLQNEFKINEN